MAQLHWSVTVEVDGEPIVTIAHNHLSGVADPNPKAIRTAVRHLLAFIGDPPLDYQPDLSKLQHVK